MARPFTPGAGNAEVEGVGLAYLTVYPNFTHAHAEPVEICVFTSYPYVVEGNPYCVEPYIHRTLHTAQAPGLIGIKESTIRYTVENDCEFRILPNQSKSCVIERSRI